MPQNQLAFITASAFRKATQRHPARKALGSDGWRVEELAVAPDQLVVELVRAMWASTGAEVVDMAVDEHDAVLAATSHLPHVLAYALVDALAQSAASADIFRFAAGGFRDFTRIASSDPAMWRDIAIANGPALLDSIDLFSEHLGRLRQAVVDQDAQELFNTFTRAKQARDEFAAVLAERGQRKS